MSSDIESVAQPLAAQDAAELQVYSNYVDRFLDHTILGFLDSRDGGQKQYDASGMRDMWSRLVEDIRDGRKSEHLDFYIHIPFCSDICKFCNISTKKLNQPEQLTEYVKYLTDCMQFYSQAFSGIRFDNLQLGGGTASILSAMQMERLFSVLFKYFSFHPDGERSFEFHPASLSQEKLQVLKRFNFNKVYIGVQSLTDEVLIKENRFHTYKTVRDAVLWTKKFGFSRGFDVDLIMGLEGETPDSFLRSFEKTAALEPNEISVFLLKPFGHHMTRQFGRSVGRFYEAQSYGRELACLSEKMIADARRWGYELDPSPLIDFRFRFLLKAANGGVPSESNGFFLVPPYSDTALGGRSLFGLGSGARSHICGYLAYFCGPVGGRFNAKAPVYSGRPIDLRNDMLRYLFHHIEMRDAPKISMIDFEQMFKCSLKEHFGPAIERLARLGAVRVEGDIVHFLPKTTREKLIYQLFFVGVEELRKMLDAYNCIVNQIRVLLDGVEFNVWIERTRPGQSYADAFDEYGLQINRLSSKPLRAGDRSFMRWLSLLFKRLFKRSAPLCGVERTFLFYTEVERLIKTVNGRSGARLVLKPWIDSSVKSGLGYVEENLPAGPDGDAGRWA